MKSGPSPKPAAPNASEQQPAGSLASSPTPRIIDSADLFLGQPLMLIQHLGEIYRLQSTRQGKLILTK